MKHKDMVYTQIDYCLENITFLMNFNGDEGTQVGQEMGSVYVYMHISSLILVWSYLGCDVYMHRKTCLFSTLYAWSEQFPAFRLLLCRSVFDPLNISAINVCISSVVQNERFSLGSGCLNSAGFSLSVWPPVMENNSAVNSPHYQCETFTFSSACWSLKPDICFSKGTQKRCAHLPKSLRYILWTCIKQASSSSENWDNELFTFLKPWYYVYRHIHEKQWRKSFSESIQGKEREP